jgi:hypothetical protein
MQKIEHFLVKTRRGQDSSVLELRAMGVQQARADSLAQEQPRPIASRDPPHERVNGSERAQLELFDAPYDRWGINE